MSDVRKWADRSGSVKFPGGARLAKQEFTCLICIGTSSALVAPTGILAVSWRLQRNAHQINWCCQRLSASCINKGVNNGFFSLHHRYYLLHPRNHLLFHLGLSCGNGYQIIWSVPGTGRTDVAAVPVFCFTTVVAKLAVTDANWCAHGGPPTFRS